MTGSHWIEDGGWFVGPVLITNTHSVGIVHHAAVRWMLERYPSTYTHDDLVWIMPVVAETYDGILSDINGQHIREDHVFDALANAKPNVVPEEGCVGGGTGMIAYEWKGGTGTASRRVAIDGRDHTVGVLVQANHGIREWLTVAGVPVGRELAALTPREHLPQRARLDHRRDRNRRAHGAASVEAFSHDGQRSVSGAAARPAATVRVIFFSPSRLRMIGPCHTRRVLSSRSRC